MTHFVYIRHIILLIVVLSISRVVVLVVITRCPGISFLSQAVRGVVVTMSVSMICKQ